MYILILNSSVKYKLFIEINAVSNMVDIPVDISSVNLTLMSISGFLISLNHTMILGSLIEKTVFTFNLFLKFFEMPLI